MLCLSKLHNCLVVGFAFCSFSCAYGLVPELPDELRPADAIVVLGNRPPVDAEGRVRAELRRRVERGVQLYQQRRAPVLVMTGGSAPEGQVEAEVMRDLALRLGVPPGDIRLESSSRDTIENAGYTLALLCGDDPHCVPDLIVVSARYHLARAERLFECAGARVQLAAAPLPHESDPDHVHYERRFAAGERVVRLYYGFIDPCERARVARARRTRWRPAAFEQSP